MLTEKEIALLQMFDIGMVVPGRCQKLMGGLVRFILREYEEGASEEYKAKWEEFARVILSMNKELGKK